ncbi:MAG TPA: helicase, partial [Chryseobacterium sp.]|nr:helicase [Chryseobacterium sp.]
ILDEFDKALELGFEEDMNYIIQALEKCSQRILTSATAMDKIPNFVGLQNEKTINFLKIHDSKPAIQLKKVITTSEEKLDTLFHLICKIGNK